MKWNIEKSEKLKNKILESEELMRDLGNSVDKILKNYKIEFYNMSYIFEPRVFTIEPDEIPEVLLKSREAMRLANLEELIRYPQLTCWWECFIVCRIRWCLPYCGIPDPSNLHELEKLKILEEFPVKQDLFIDTSEKFMEQIVGNKKLLTELSESIFKNLEKHGIKFEGNEGCVFTPIVFETPIYTQKITLPKESLPIRGFGPQIYASPTSEPAILKPKPIPGVIVSRKFPRPIPGVIIDRWWWIGIPAPEMLRALDVLREIKSI